MGYKYAYEILECWNNARDASQRPKTGVPLQLSPLFIQDL